MYMKILNKILYAFLYVLSVCVFLTSCSRTKKNAASDLNEGTLRTETAEHLKTVIWTDEIDGGVLKDKKVKNDMVSDTVSLTPAVLCTFSVPGEEPIYPEIENFGSLDVRGVSAEQWKTINGFCEAVMNDKDADIFMTEEGLASLVLFYADMRDISGQKENQACVSWLPGKPFISDELYQVPVRFIYKEYDIDLMLYLDASAGWKIDQIQIRNQQVKSNDKN